jgi:hypothetical protein
MRFLKQLLFGGIFILLVSAVAVWIYRGSIFSAPTCSDSVQNQGEEGIDCGTVCAISCEQKYLKDLLYYNVNVFKFNDLVSIYFDLDNPNQNFGLKDFKYKIDLYGSTDKFLRSIEGESFIYPGQNKDSKSGSKKVVEAGVRVLGDIKYVRISFSNIDWSPSSEFRSINLENENMTTNKDGDFFVISGMIKSLVSFDMPQVVINVFLKDKFGKILGVSKTELSQLLPFEERKYKVFIEINKALEPSVDFSSSEAVIYPVY